MVKAQVGIEYIAIILLLLVILIPLVYLGFTSIQSAGQVYRTKVAVDAINDAADRVYALGAGARTSIQIYLPGGISSANLTGNEINYRVFLPGGATTDVFDLAKGNVSGTLPTSVGEHVLSVSMNSSGIVTINESLG